MSQLQQHHMPKEASNACILQCVTDCFRQINVQCQTAPKLLCSKLFEHYA